MLVDEVFLYKSIVLFCHLLCVQLNVAARAGRELSYDRSKLDHVKFKEGLLWYIAS